MYRQSGFAISLLTCLAGSLLTGDGLEQGIICSCLIVSWCLARPRPLPSSAAAVAAQALADDPIEPPSDWAAKALVAAAAAPVTEPDRPSDSPAPRLATPHMRAGSSHRVFGRRGADTPSP
jgi:hypothetical protein